MNSEVFNGFQNHHVSFTYDNSSAHQAKSTFSQRSSKVRPIPSKQKSVDRVIVPNVAYLMNLPENIASDEILRNQRFLGQYGRIEKIILHKNGTAHVTFTSINSAQLCIKSLDNFHYCGSRISALVGTTKYPEDVDMNKIMLNSLNEPPIAPCPNPVFPSPSVLSPRQTSNPTTFTHNSTATKMFGYEHRHMAPGGSHMEPRGDSNPVCGLQGLVFGTGCMVDPMWLAAAGSGAFVPRQVTDDEDSCLSVSFSELDSWEVTSLSEASLTSNSNRQAEDFWSSSSESGDTNADDCEGSLTDDSLSLDLDDSPRTSGPRPTYPVPPLSLPLDSALGLDSTTTSLPFSPCKEMVKALTAHVWKPSIKGCSYSPAVGDSSSDNIVHAHMRGPHAHHESHAHALPRSRDHSHSHAFQGGHPMAYGYPAPMAYGYPYPYMHMPMPAMMMQPMPLHAHAASHAYSRLM